MRFCPLFSGSSGNALFVEGEKERLLIDAGLPGRTVEQALRLIGVAPETLSAILVTHEHSDHVKGVGVLARKYGLPVYANAPCWQAMLPLTGEISPRSMRVFETGRDFYLGSLNIFPFPTPHDCAEPVGYGITEQGKRLTVMTDIGHMSEGMLDMAAHSDLLLLESNHDVDMLKAGPYPYPLKQRILSSHGHLSNEAAGRALARLYGRGVRNAILGHLSAENNDPRLARLTAEQALHEEGAEMRLAVARRDGPTGIFTLE